MWAKLLSYPYNQQYDVSPDGQRFLIVSGVQTLDLIEMTG